MENIKTSPRLQDMKLLYKAPTFKLAVISLEIRFLVFSLFILFFFFHKKKNSLINVQLICMMARNNIFLWLNIPATGQTMKMIPSSQTAPRARVAWVVWVGKTKLFPSTSSSTLLLRNFFLSSETFFYHKMKKKNFDVL